MPQTPDQGLYLLVDNTIHGITGYLVHFYIADGTDYPKLRTAEDADLW